MPNAVRVAETAILMVYTECVEGGTVAWDAANREPLGRGHPERNITLSEIEEATNDPDRDDEPAPKREPVRVLRGRTHAGRLLYVAHIPVPAGRYPVHAHAIWRRGRLRSNARLDNGLGQSRISTTRTRGWAAMSSWLRWRQPWWRRASISGQSL